jgi:hypothetical protein
MVTDLHYKRKIKTKMIVGSVGLDGPLVLERMLLLLWLEIMGVFGKDC